MKYSKFLKRVAKQMTIDRTCCFLFNAVGVIPSGPGAVLNEVPPIHMKSEYVSLLI